MFIRNQHRLATLAVAVLLAASSQTALAQPRIGFTPTVGTVNESATADTDSEHPLLTVTVRVWGLPAGPTGQGADGQPTTRQQAIDALGEITVETDGIGGREAATVSPVYDTAAALDEDVVFADSDFFRLTVTPVQDDDSKDDEFTLRLRSTESIRTGLAFRGTVIDDDPLATATFGRTGIRVVEDSTTPLRIRIAPPEGENYPALAGSRNVALRITPAAAVDVTECPTEGEPGFALRIWSETETLGLRSGTGELTINKDLREYEHGPVELRLTACDDMSSFGDSSITVAFKQSSLQTPNGRIAAGPPAVIQVLNNDPLPTVFLPTPAITIEEGMTQTAAILTDGELANLVMTVGVAVAGDALISLSQGGRTLRANADGTYSVDLDVNGSAVLTVRADGDEALTDNQTKMATVMIVDASGAEIGNEDTLTVTVRGSTAVPALPLIGQLLLALLIAAVAGWQAVGWDGSASFALRMGDRIR